MNSYKIVSTTILLFILSKCFAQNLVLNPGFALHASGDSISDTLTKWTYLDHHIKSWDCPFRTKAKFKRASSTNQQGSKDSSIVVLMQIGAPSSDDPNYHKHDYITYLQGTFKEALNEGKKYRLSIRIKSLLSNDSKPILTYHGKDMSDTSHVNRLVDCSGLGIKLLEKKQESVRKIQTQSDIRKSTNTFYCDKILSTNGDWEWFRIDFTASANATHFLIGNFMPKELTNYSLQENEREVHYITSQKRNIIEERIAKYMVDSITIEEQRADSNSITLLPTCQPNHKSITVPITYQTIDFEHDQAQLDSESKKLLMQFCQNIDSLDRLEIIGYTDSRSNEEYNFSLSERRVEVVKSFILKHSQITSSRVTDISLGETFSSKLSTLNIKQVELFLDKSEHTISPNNSIKFYSDNRENPTIESLDEKKTERELSDFSSFNLTPEIAYNEILSLSPKYDVLFIGENHLFPAHRIFLQALLDSLYSQGYRHLFLEAINPYINSKTLKQIPYPNINMGFYIREPNFGSLVRKALNIGIELHSYEYKNNQLSKARKDIDRFYLDTCSSGGWFLEPDGTKYSLEEGEIRFSMRSYIQAFNIAKKIPQLNGKVIILGGESHNRNFKHGCLSSTSYWLHLLTDKKILNIGQSTDKAAPSLQKEPFVLKKEEQYYGSLRANNELEGKEVIMEVYYPENLSLNLLRSLLLSCKEFKFRIPNFIQDPAQVLIYNRSENCKDAVPVYSGVIATNQEQSIWLEDAEYTGFCLYENKIYPLHIE